MDVDRYNKKFKRVFMQSRMSNSFWKRITKYKEGWFDLYLYNKARSFE